MNQDELHGTALIETLSIAKQKYLKTHPELLIKDLTLDSDHEKEVIEFWNELGPEASEKVTTEFRNWERPRGKILKLDQVSHRDLANFAISQHERYTGRNYQRELIQTLISVARRDGQLSHQIHASDAQSIITAITSEGPKIDTFAILIKYSGRDVNID